MGNARPETERASSPRVAIAWCVGLLLLPLHLGLDDHPIFLAAIVRGSLVPEYFGRAYIGRIGAALSSLGIYARALAPIGAAALAAT